MTNFSHDQIKLQTTVNAFKLFFVAAGLMAAFSSGAVDHCSGLNDLPDALEKACNQESLDPLRCPYHNMNFGVLETRSSPVHYLLIPYAKVCGIEDKQLWTLGKENWFADAWQQRHLLVDAKILSYGAPLSRIGIALNSERGRSEGQLHVHINCVRKNIDQQLSAKAGQFNEQWGKFDFNTIEGNQSFWVRKYPGPDLPASVFFDFASNHPDIASNKNKIAAFAAPAPESGSADILVFIGRDDQNNRGHTEALLGSCAE